MFRKEFMKFIFCGNGIPKLKSCNKKWTDDSKKRFYHDETSYNSQEEKIITDETVFP